MISTFVDNERRQPGEASTQKGFKRLAFYFYVLTNLTAS